MPKASTFARALFGLSAMLYPLAAIWLLPMAGAAGLGLLLLGVTALRALLLRRALAGREWWVLALTAGYGLLLVVLDGPLLALLYPSLVSLALALAFAASAFAERTLIERFAELAGDPVPPHARGYARVLTWVWAALLTGNALVAASLAYAGALKWWALYTGALSYAVMGGFALLEFGYRQFYKRRSVARLAVSDYDAGPLKH